ncbi:hypothetical protein SAMN04489729_7444 [Amycolatopsis lurida]|uniref:Uncharacterized protein n=1 Tax=Amycolatopsis lurida NRRL 2430 TaxID=1460371 RepID=A0A2P2FUP3_AMYLU|nr:hypothetical protein [Amycolatopsis lurida]KFU80457.1 hypothetical protein BB31_14845 [Amycolatopsis lurida NRRL 2430]SEE41681.1 hypothetical protein SAMN04489729_7444 [Amycolatopsis lurida]
MYRLQAVLVTESARGELLASAEGVRLVPLGHDLSLMPVTEVLFDAAELRTVLAECSEHGAVAYVEAEYFGGARRATSSPRSGSAGTATPAIGFPLS